MTGPVRLLGLEFAGLTAEAAASAIAARPPGSPFAYVVTPNADHFVRVSRDPALADVYRNAWLRLLDSRVVARLACAAGLAAPPVATGSDLTALLLRQHLNPGERVTIIGLRAAHVPALMDRCGLAKPFHYDPPMGFDRDPPAFARTVDFIRAHPSRFIFLAVGSPRQERLAAAAAAAAGATGTGLCIGAGLDFLAGAARRAPAWMQSGGLEWAYRLAGNPRRLAQRYLIDSPRVLPLLLRQRAGYG